MAIAFTTPSPIAEQFSADQASYTTAGSAGANGKGYLITVCNVKGTTTPDTPTLTHAGGLTCVQITTALRGSIMRITVFRAHKASGVSAGTFTADFAGVTQTGCIIIVDEVTGMDTSGTDLSGAIVQSASANGSSATSPTTATATLAAFANATDNATWFAAYANVNAAWTPETGYTELADIGHGLPNRSAQTEYKIGEDTSPSAQVAAAAQYVCVGLEIRAAAGTLAPASLIHARATGSPTASPTLALASLVYPRALGSPVVSGAGPVTLLPAALVRTRALGSPRVNPTVPLTALVRSRALGQAAVKVALLPTGLVRSRTLGALVVSPQARPSALVRTRALGNINVFIPVSGPTGSHPFIRQPD